MTGDPIRAPGWKSQSTSVVWYERLPLHKNSVIYVNQRFLFKPVHGWTVDLDAMNDAAIEACRDDDTTDHVSDDPKKWAGVIIREIESGGVWVLTGECKGNVYEAVWPD